jgi:hypothetical protein
MTYYKNNERFFEIAVNQIKSFYPEAVIHVITDEPKQSNDLIYHYIKGLEKNNYAKLHVLDLLDEPAIYMDTDILLLKRFEDLPDVECFNLFQEYLDTSAIPKHMQEYTHYNTGVIWIPKPNKEIAKEIRLVRNNFLIHKNGWVNDEYPISWVVNKLGLKMVKRNDVNYYRSKIVSFNDLFKYQSVHYTGSDFLKNLLLEEYKLVKVKL